MGWIEMLGGLLGGGVIVKFVEFMRYRVEDGSKMRSEFWKEIGALREVCDRQEREIKELQGQIVKYQTEVMEQRIAKHKAANVANMYKLRLWQAMTEVNQRDAAAGAEPTYDMSAEQQNMLHLEHTAHTEAIDQVVAGHEMAAKTIAADSASRQQQASTPGNP